MEIAIESVLGIKEKIFYSIITRIQSEIISIKLKNPPNIYLKVFDTILNFYTTVEYNMNVSIALQPCFLQRVTLSAY